MIYFILGGSGFIGSRLCERLKVDFRIVDKVSPPKAFVDRFSFADVRDFNSLHSVLSKNASTLSLEVFSLMTYVFSICDFLFIS